MAITLNDFNKIWASTSPLTPYSFSDNNYKQGWNFVGGTPPARQMWDSYMKRSDEKQQYIVNHFLPLSGGTMTGTINVANGTSMKGASDTGYVGIYNNSGGGGFLAFGTNNSARPGFLHMVAKDSSQSTILEARPNGTFTWGGKNVERVNASGTNYVRYENGLQICWKSGVSFDTNGTQIVFPVPFKDATYAVNVTGRGLTTSTSIGILKVTTKDSAGFVAMAVATSNISSFAGGTADYIAIGLWK